MKIKTTRADVIWNYIGTAVSMISGFMLLPLLMHYLTSKELGLWYVYVAIGNLAMLFEFGFNPTFARNIVYVVSGARELNASGRASRTQKGIDWHLLNVVIRASQWIYAVIACMVAVLLATVGSLYVAFITTDMNSSSQWFAWILFCVAITLNLYFLYSITILRGYGDVAGENQAKTAGKILQILVSAILLVLGFGLVGAAIGYFVNAVVLRVLALFRMRKHTDIEGGRKTDTSHTSFAEIKALVGTVSHLAWRDGVVQIALYLSTQAMSIFSSLYLGLAQTGMYSILLQLATAIGTFATAYAKSYFPSMQSAFADDDKKKQQSIVSTGITAFWILMLLGILGTCVVILPILPFFKRGLVISYPLFIVMTVYIGLLQQHSIFCNYIISMNEIPYMSGYVVGAILGVVFVYIFSGLLHMGAWGIILGQAISQIIYNNWKWPVYLCRRLGMRYWSIFSRGSRELVNGLLHHGVPVSL